MVTCGTDRKIKLVDITKFQVLEELDDTTHKKTVRSVAWKPHSNVLAAGSFDSTVSIWGQETDGYLDEQVTETELMAIIEGHENEIKCVAWSSDGNWLATCSRDKSIWIWEADEYGEEFECISVLQEHTQDVKHVAWHSFLPILVSSSYDDTLRIWKDVDDDWECCAILNGHDGTVWSADFEKSETDVRVCSGSDDGSVRIWCLLGDLNDHEQEWVQQAVLPKVHSRSIYSVSWGSNGYIASTGSDGMIVIYEEIDGNWKVIAKKQLSHGVYEANIVKWAESDGKTILLTGGDDGNVNIWDFST